MTKKELKCIRNWPQTTSKCAVERTLRRADTIGAIGN